MDFLIEILIELFFELIVEGSTNKKIPKWIRYPLGFLIVLFILIVLFGLVFLGFVAIKESILFAFFLWLLSLSFSVCFFFKIRSFIEKQNSKN